MVSRYSLGLLVVSLMLFITYSLAQTPKRKAAKPKASTPPSAPALETDEAVPRDRISIHELKRKLDAKLPVLILDNRAGSSWLGSLVKIKGAIHIPLSELESRLDQLPRDVEIVTYCT